MAQYIINTYINATTEIVAIVFLIIIFVSGLLRKKETPTKRPFSYLTFTLILLLTESAVSWILNGILLKSGQSPSLNLALSILIILDYTLYTIIGDLFFLYVVASIEEKKAISKENKKKAKITFRVLLAISLLSSLAFASSLWTGIFFSVDEYGGIVSTPAYWGLTLFNLLPSYINIYLILKNNKVLGKAKTVSCLFYLIIPPLLIIADIFLGIVSSYLSVAVIMIIIYIDVDIQQDRKLLENETALAKQETENTEMRVNLMMSQIQPHFLYNSLSSIACLCRKDPKEAENAINDFSDYLRMNLRSINTSHPILFETELNHVENYLNIQKRRFPKQMNIEYDIKAKDFRIPALTLQPIVENAVKYGVEARYEETTIKISSEETDSEYIISVNDNGPGFDVTQEPSNDRAHIGLKSVENRLAKMVNGTITIQSTVGVGTNVLITIPKNTKEV